MIPSFISPKVWDFECSRGLPRQKKSFLWWGIISVVGNDVLYFKFSCRPSGLTRNYWPPCGSATQFSAELWILPPKYILPCRRINTQRSINTHYSILFLQASHAWLQACRSTFEMVPPSGTQSMQMVSEWMVLSVCCHCFVRYVLLLVACAIACLQRHSSL